MKAKLTRRIREVLSQPLTPSAMTSFLADTRKLLEAVGATKQYKALKFHCDWVLHTKMDRGIVRDLLKEFDEIWDGWITHRRHIPKDFADSLANRIGFYGFEQELRQFLGKYGIQLPAADSREIWLPFEKVYCEIVEDCPLRYSDAKHPLKHINGARVKTYRMSEDPEEKELYAPGDYLPLGIEWEFLKDDEPVFVLTITFPSVALIERERQSHNKS